MTETPDYTKFYDSANVQTMTRLPWSTIVAREAAGTFPKRVIVAGLSGDVWLKSEVDAWKERHG